MQSDGTLEFIAETMGNVDERPTNEGGYFAWGTSDAGNGLMVTDGIDGNTRYTFLGLANFMNVRDAPGSFNIAANREGECRMYATKLTGEMIDWLLQMARDNTYP